MSLGLATGTFLEYLEALQALFPPAPLDEADVLGKALFKAAGVPLSEVPRLLASSTQKSLRTAARRSAPGPPGWRYEHIQILLSHFDGVVALTAVLQLLLDGNVPNQAASLLRRAALVPRLKPNGGARPLAVGETFRRLAARSLLLQERVRLKEAVAPHQQAIGQKAACELVVKSLRLLAQAHPDCIIATLDLRNAYNTLSRAAVLEAVVARTPWLAPMTLLFYSSPSSYTYRNDYQSAQVWSPLGVEQGDVEAPALFALALAPALQTIQEELNLICLTESLSPVTIMAYLDDIVVSGPPPGH